MNFFYEAVDQSGKTVLGKIDAANETDAQQRLLQSGYRPHSIVANTASNGLGTPTAQNLPAVANTTQYLNTRTPEHLNTQHPTPNTQHPITQLPNYPMTQSPVASARTGGITLAGNAAKLATQSKANTVARSSPVTLAPAAPNVSPLGGVTTRDQMWFFRQLSQLTHSGMTIYSALDNLAGRTPNKNLALTAHEMADAARNGERISDVMEKYPRIYPDHIVGTVRAGELGGFLEIALAEIALNYEQNIALYRGAWIPKAMATQAFFMFAFAQPAFPTLFPNADFRGYLMMVLLRNIPISIGIYGLIRWGSRHLQLPQFRRKRDEWALRMPPFGDLQRQAALAAFIRMLRKLFHAGVSPIQAWEGAMNTAGNVVIRDKLAESYQLMQQGATLPDAFAATGLFANQIEQLIVTGQQSGQVVESLDQIAEYYQGQVDQAASKSRFAMLRLGILAMIILGGGTMLWLAYKYAGVLYSFMGMSE